MSVYLSRWI